MNGMSRPLWRLHSRKSTLVVVAHVVTWSLTSYFRHFLICLSPGRVRFTKYPGVVDGLVDSQEARSLLIEFSVPLVVYIIFYFPDRKSSIIFVLESILHSYCHFLGMLAYISFSSSSRFPAQSLIWRVSSSHPRPFPVSIHFTHIQPWPWYFLNSSCT